MPKDIGLDEMRRLVDEGAQVVEVLPRREYDEEHIPGAVNIPLKTLNETTAAQLDKTRPVVVYCWDYLCDMSPRAAWQLEAMGFSDVSDFVDGKLEWISHGLPLEGNGPHFAVAGEIADRDAVLECQMGERLGDVARALDTVPHDYCVVLNDHDIVLGRVRKRNLRGPDDTAVEHIMEPGPTTVRASEPVKGLLERMRNKKVPAVIVTTSKGRLMGTVTQEALDRLLPSRR
jgi:rhodanese-related sulfurtransferase